MYPPIRPAPRRAQRKDRAPVPTHHRILLLGDSPSLARARALLEAAGASPADPIAATPPWLAAAAASRDLFTSALDLPSANPDRSPLAPEPALDFSYLIGRPPRALDDHALTRARRAIHNKRVLITGAGGSIGSELAIQVASLGPELLILMERAENALFDIDRRLAERFPRLPRKAMLHDVVEDRGTLDRLLRLRPHAVFHAAAHKHVTVMEDHPAHAVNNNLFGAKAIADAALAASVERFVMISTDKAVNPRNVMGATKRFAELYVRSRNAPSSPTRFSMVRFGNVLGSACSVLPIWSRQLSDGGPITVTHPEMTRFFMTIPEAAQLVIQAGALTADEAHGADIFVLDMGQPVRIVELAERFLRAQGLEPRFTNRPSAPASSRPAIDIVFTGPRPGEKLHEELAHASEALRPTPAPGVLAWAGPPSDPLLVADLVETLSAVRHSADNQAVLDAIARFTPGFRGPDAQDSPETHAPPRRTTPALPAA